MNRIECFIVSTTGMSMDRIVKLDMKQSYLIRELGLLSRVVVTLLSVGLPQTGQAQVVFNFAPVDTAFGDHGRIDVRCYRPEGPNISCVDAWSNVDGTPFLQELYVDPQTNQSYYHVIVGLPESGFVQETYIRANGQPWEGGLGSASLGDGICRFDRTQYNINECNMGDVLGATHDNVFTGNGSGDPRAAQIRQLVGGTWNDATKSWTCGTNDTFCQQFLKNSFSNKPVITQTLQDAATGMKGFVQIDMSNSDYATDAIAGTLSNTLEFTLPQFIDIPGFNFATDKSEAGSRVTAGQYIFTGTGPTNATLEPYRYIDGGGFLLDRDWTRFANPGNQ